MMVIEKNKTKILIGLIDVLLVNWFQTFLIGAKLNEISKIAPKRAISQYVDNVTFPILIFGNNKTDNVTRTNVIKQITNVGIINNVYYLPLD